MNENETNQPTSYVHPVRVSFSLESAFLGSFLLCSLGAVVSLIMSSWNRIEYLDAAAANQGNHDYVNPFLAPYMTSKNWAIFLLVLSLGCLGLGLYFRFKKKKKSA